MPNPDIVYSTDSYCSLCDLYFPTLEARAEHVDLSSNHPGCDTCDRRFLNKNILRNHYTYSRNHHYCAACRISFESAAGLRIHVEYAAVHRDDSDDEGLDDDEFQQEEGWEDKMAQLRYPVEIGGTSEDTDPDGNDTSDDDGEWEEFDEYDFEDEEDLWESDVVSVSSVESDLNSDGSKEIARIQPISPGLVQFSCPLCKRNLQDDTSLCSTACGHIFCTQCIRQVYKRTGQCPVCDQVGSVKHLRKMYVGN